MPANDTDTVMADQPPTSVHLAGAELAEVVDATIGGPVEQDAAEVKDEDEDEDEEEEGDSSSTLQYGQESFETFQHKVTALCTKLWPAASRFEIERMEGGSYNRIIGITVHTAEVKPAPTGSRRSSIKQALQSVKRFIRRNTLGKSTDDDSPSAQVAAPQKFILRIPREDDNRVDYECTILNFVGKFFPEVPASAVVYVDLTTGNPIESRYVVQNRLPGRRVDDHYAELNTAQRISLAKDVARIWTSLQSHSFSTGGQLHPTAEINPPSEPTILRCALYLVDEPHNSQPLEPSAPKDSNPIDWYSDLADRGAAKNAEELGNKNSCEPWGWMDLAITWLVNKTDIFDDKRFYFCHRDFEPRNLLFEIIDDSTARISGVLDWDRACFTPQVVGCSPPSWLWAWDTYESYAEADDKDLIVAQTPSDPDSALIKSAFDSAAGPTFMRLAYNRPAIVARELCYFAIEGLNAGDGPFMSIWKQCLWMAKEAYEITGTDLGEDLEPLFRDDLRRFARYVPMHGDEEKFYPGWKQKYADNGWFYSKPKDDSDDEAEHDEEEENEGDDDGDNKPVETDAMQTDAWHKPQQKPNALRSV